MFNTKFILIDGTEVFPNYLGQDQRTKLKQKIGERKEVMWCGCRSDIKLYYRLSADNKFYPEHNNYSYEHSQYCFKYHTEDSKRTTAIVRSDEETATVYLKFNPKNFTIPSASNKDDQMEDAEDDMIEDSQYITSSDSSEENELLHLKQLNVDTTEYKEPKFNLAAFVRCINYDTFSERAINNKPILSGDYFSNAILGRLNRIQISGTKKSVRNLTLEDDGVRFIYASYAGCDIKNTTERTTYNILVKGSENKTFALFTFGSIYEKALEHYHKQYGEEPGDSTMIAGFQYYQQSNKYGGMKYKVLGRIHLFKISSHGIYCSSSADQIYYDTIINFVRRNIRTEKIRFYIPAEEEIVNGILEIEGCHRKGVIIFQSTKGAKKFTIDNSLYEPLLISQDYGVSDETLRAMVKKIKEEK